MCERQFSQEPNWREMKLHDHEYRCQKCGMLHPSEMDRFFKNQQANVIREHTENHQFQVMVATMYHEAKVRYCFIKYAKESDQDNENQINAADIVMRESVADLQIEAERANPADAEAIKSGSVLVYKSFREALASCKLHDVT